ncbi:MAG: SpoIID/LytB domain-containing protein, partial [Kineosporiaceae bacterium]
MNRRTAVPAAVAAAGTAVLLALPALATPSAPTGAPAGAPAGTPAARAVRVPGSFVLGGGGYGHGVGMSQYGAQAQALAGRSARQILSTYYTGTSLTAVRDDADIRVQILGDATSTNITSRAIDELGGRYAVIAGRRALKGRPGDRLVVATSGSGVRATLTHAGKATSISGGRLVVRWQGTREMAGPATVVSVRGAAGTYRRGHLEITNIIGLLSVVNVLRLGEEYLDGIDEVPASWAPAALQAQAIAARTYAIKAMAGGVYRWCDCHVYADTRSQVFHGWSREGAPGSGPRWTAAVRATTASSRTGLVVTYRGAPIDAVYFSSDGGHTENSEDVWSTAVPYLRGVPDPWSAGGGNPLATWSRTRSQAQVAAAFGLPDVVWLDLSDRTGGGGVQVAVATSSSGRRARISGASLENRLGLPSWWVSRPARRVAGGNRWSTALAAAALVAPAPPGEGRTVVVAGAQPLTAEAAVAAPLAHHLHSPLLLVARDAVPAAVAAYLAAHPPSTILVVGGADTVSDAVVAGLAGTGRTVTRVAGVDRYATAELVAQRIGAPAGFAVVAPGDDAALATTAAAAAVAAAADRPLLLVPGDAPGAPPSGTPTPSGSPTPTPSSSVTPTPSPPGTAEVPPAVATVLRALGVRGAVCAGTPAELSEAVRLALPGCVRVAGTDPAGTAAALVRSFDRTVALRTVAVSAAGAAQLTDAVAGGALGLPVLYAGRAAPTATV